jgi:hypothetical protein
MNIKTLVLMSILLFLLFCIIPSSAISTLTIGNKEFSTVGENATIDFYLDVVPDGLVGGKYLVHIDNDSVASISDVKLPPWALLKANSSNLQNDVWLKVFAQPSVIKGTKNVYLGSVIVTAHEKGSTPITIQLSDSTDIHNLKYWFDDVNGNVINMKVVPGVITVQGTNSIPSSSTGSPSGTVITSSLNSTKVSSINSTTVPSSSLTNVPSTSSPKVPSTSSRTVIPSTQAKSSLSLPLILVGGILGALFYSKRTKRNDR